MNYEKPKIQVLNLALDKAIASAQAGIGTWLVNQGFEADAANNITTYEVNS